MCQVDASFHFHYLYSKIIESGVPCSYILSRSIRLLLLALDSIGEYLKVKRISVNHTSCAKSIRETDLAKANEARIINLSHADKEG